VVEGVALGLGKRTGTLKKGYKERGTSIKKKKGTVSEIKGT